MVRLTLKDRSSLEVMAQVAAGCVAAAPNYPTSRHWAFRVISLHEKTLNMGDRHFGSLSQRCNY